MTKAVQDAPRPLRRDAERNRQQILDVAGAVFAEHGLDASFDEIARRAGVGVGTVYRRFPDREDLVEALFERRLGDVVTMAEDAARQPVAWDALCSFLEGSMQMQVADQALKQVLVDSGHGRERLARMRERLTPAVASLMERAKAEGSLRRDVEVTDVAAITTMLSSATTVGEPALWQRYLVLMLDGLREERGRCTALPRPAPDDLVVAELAHRHSR
ncbi:MAG: TetR/AcrR family transcriptional regulator [Mycobacteriaceae bacterium]